MRPVNVVWFERLSYAAVIIGVLGMPLWKDVVVQAYRVHPAAYIAILAISLAYEVLMIWLVARRRQNWARWFTLISFGALTSMTLYSTAASFHANPAGTIEIYALKLLDGAALYFVFTGDAREWFRK